MDHETHLGLDHRDQLVSIPRATRSWHTFIIGATGVGKSTVMENMIAQDMARGDGVMVLDPHGTLAETCLHLVPPQRMNYVGLFDPTDRINNRIALFVIDTQFRHLSLDVPVFVWGASPAFADSLRGRALVNRARTRSRPSRASIPRAVVIDQTAFPE